MCSTNQYNLMNISPHYLGKLPNSKDEKHKTPYYIGMLIDL